MPVKIVRLVRLFIRRYMPMYIPDFRLHRHQLIIPTNLLPCLFEHVRLNQPEQADNEKDGKKPVKHLFRILSDVAAKGPSQHMHIIIRIAHAFVSQTVPWDDNMVMFVGTCACTDKPLGMVSVRAQLGDSQVPSL